MAIYLGGPWSRRQPSSSKIVLLVLPVPWNSGSFEVLVAWMAVFSVLPLLVVCYFVIDRQGREIAVAC